MPPMPIISGHDVIAALCRLGYREIRQRGSHVRLVCEYRSPLTVPLHAEIRRGTLRSILRTADVSLADLLRLLK